MPTLSKVTPKPTNLTKNIGKKALEKAIGNILGTKQTKINYIPGELGTLKDGKEVVQVPNRANFVYVKLGGSINETIQAFNDKVDYIFGLKVILESPHDGISYYRVFSIDSQQRETWDGHPFLARHGFEHSFGDGLDPVFLFQRQLVEPLGVLPISTGNNMSVFVQKGVYEWKGQRKYWGGDFSPSYVSATPTGAHIRYFSLYLDGNDGTLKNLTGTLYDLLPYGPTGTVDLIPTIAGSLGIPLAGVSVTSGMVRMDWTNLTDLRHFLNQPGLYSQITGAVTARKGDGSYVGPRQKLSFKEGVGIGLTVVDDPGGSEIDITLSFTGSVGGNVIGNAGINQVAYWTGTTGIGGNVGFTWDKITVTIVPTASNSGSPKTLLVTGPAHTNLTKSVEAIDIHLNLARTVQFVSGTLATQRAVVLEAPTYAFTQPSTITNAATLAITGAPATGTNATLTTPLALWVQADNVLFGSAPVDATLKAGLEIRTSVTAVSTYAVSLFLSSTLIAHANSDILRGDFIYPVFAKGSFTNLHAAGLVISFNTFTGGGTIADYAAVQLLEATLATSNTALMVGAYPTGIATNYSLYLNSANALFLGSGPVRLDSQHSTGAQTASFVATNKPGSSVTLTPQTWLKLNLGGTDYYFPGFI